MIPVIVIEVFKEEGQYVAQCVEHDFVVQADSIWNVLYEMGRMIAAHQALKEDGDGRVAD